MADSFGSREAHNERSETDWVGRYGDLVRFIEAHDRMPHEQPGGGIENRAESLLGGWARYQRRRFARGNLPGWQHALLEQIKLFSFDPYADLWNVQYELLAVFQARHRKVPSYRSQDLSERALGAWVHKQRHVYKTGQLSADRVSALRELPIKIV
jgi:Helicase associated domain